MRGEFKVGGNLTGRCDWWRGDYCVREKCLACGYRNARTRAEIVEWESLGSVRMQNLYIVTTRTSASKFQAVFLPEEYLCVWDWLCLWVRHEI